MDSEPQPIPVKPEQEIIEKFQGSNGTKFEISDDNDHLIVPNGAEIKKQLRGLSRDQMEEKIAKQWQLPVEEEKKTWHISQTMK